MARFAAIATGNWSTAATWNQITNTPTISSGTNITISTTNLFTQTFTAPNTTNACTGVGFFVNGANTSGGNITVTLQESTVDTAATVTVACSALPTQTTWIYFKFASPYVFTTTGAGAYRFKIVNSSSSNTPNWASDSGGANLAYMATDDRTGPPAAGDDTWYWGNNGANSITVTMDGTQSCGSATDTTVTSSISTMRSVGYAINLCDRATLIADTAASAQLTCKGNFVIGPNAEFDVGTSGTPYPAARTFTLIFNMNATGQAGLCVTNTTAKCKLYAVAKSSTSLWKTTYTSGTGVAASPLVVADSVDWDVGDEIVVASTGTSATAYQETENKFIITKNSATSYVLSDTSGGSEAAFTYTHTTDAQIFNLTRNVVIKGISSSLLAGFVNNSTTAGNTVLQWVRFENMGANTISSVTLAPQGTAALATCDYTVNYGPAVRHGFIIGSTVAQTFTGLIGHNCGTTSAQGAAISLLASANITLVDCVALKNQGSGFGLIGAYGCTLTRPTAISNNLGAQTSFGGMTFGNQLGFGSSTITGANIHANRLRGIITGVNGAGVTGIVLSNCMIGSKGQNAIDVDISSSSLTQLIFNNSTFGSTTLINNYLNSLIGSEVGFQTINETDNNNRWYTNRGVAYMAGASLSDTTTRTAGNYSVKIAPEDNTTGFYWDFFIPSPKSNIINFFCYAQKNVAFGTSTARFELYLPGLVPGIDAASDTYTLTNDTGSWQPVSMSANYSSTTVDGLATIRVVGITSTSAAYLYVADLFNADSSTIQALGGLRVWADGKPSPLINTATLSAGDVWTYDTTNLTTANTTGKKLVDGLTTDDFIGLK